MTQLLEASRELHKSGLKKVRVQDLFSLEQRIRGVFDKPNKQISQLIAKKWLEGAELTKNDIRQLLKEENLDIVIDKQPYSEWHRRKAHPEHPPIHNYEGYWVIPDNPDEPIELYVPFPERPPEGQLATQELNDWIAQDSGVVPFYPTNVWIPYSC
ncbi:MAG: hypothetical protein WBG70_18990 [Spirulinaceae cyanobacterium]